MDLLPDIIEICPIDEAVFEIRYTSKSPVDAIFGILYSKIKDFFTGNPVPLPILQLPEAVRSQDPNLKYQAYHQLQKDNLILKIGPKMLGFSNLKPYSGWKNWSEFFYNVLKEILQTEVINQVERIGLRYINLFNTNIFDKVKFEIKINKDILKDESTHLRTEILDEGFIKILQIGNSVNVIKINENIISSFIDIDCIYNIEDDFNFFKNYKDIVEKAHIKEKTLFFSLLEDSFLKELKPYYGEK